MLTQNIRRIITRGVIDMATSRVIESEGYDYVGPMALADAAPSLEMVVKSIEAVGLAAKEGNEKIDKQIADLVAQGKASKEEIEQLRQKQIALERGGRGTGTLPSNASAPSFGKLFADDAHFKEFRSGKVKHVSFDVKQSIATAVRTKAILTNVGQSGDSPQVNFPNAPEFLVGAPSAAPGRRLLVLQALPHRSVSDTGSVIVPVVQSVSDGAAPQQHEGSQKSESVIRVIGEQLQLPAIATYLNASRQVLSDSPALPEFLNAWLQFFCLRKLESLVIAGDGGSTDKVTGLLHGGTQFLSTEDHAIDRIGQCIATGLPAYGYAPNLVIISPLDYWRALSAKDANGRYIGNGWGGPFTGTLWGVPVVSSPGCPAGKAIVLDTALVEIIDREEVHIEIGYVGNQFTSNEATVLAELRANLAINDPSAVQYIQLPVDSPNA